MRTLFLTTPHMRGVDVQLAQAALQDNGYGDFLNGTIDSEFGPESARACKRAKYWLGYPTDAIDYLDGSYGAELHSYLDGGVRLSAAKWLRRKIRLRQQPETPLRVRALNIARTQNGVNEDPPNSNNVLYSRWYLRQDPAPAWAFWCAMFTSWCYWKAGSQTFAANVRYAYVPYVVTDARRGVNNLAVTTTPQPGDLVCYQFGSRPDHIGLFDKWVNANQFWAWEGNTSQTSDDDGGEVMHRLRNRSSVVCFVHVGR